MSSLIWFQRYILYHLSYLQAFRLIVYYILLENLFKLKKLLFLLWVYWDFDVDLLVQWLVGRIVGDIMEFWVVILFVLDQKLLLSWFKVIWSLNEVQIWMTRLNLLTRSFSFWLLISLKQLLNFSFLLLILIYL